MKIWVKSNQAREMASTKALRQHELQRLEEQAEGSVAWLDCHEEGGKASEMSVGPDHVRHCRPG